MVKFNNNSLKRLLVYHTIIGGVISFGLKFMIFPPFVVGSIIAVLMATIFTKKLSQHKKGTYSKLFNIWFANVVTGAGIIAACVTLHIPPIFHGLIVGAIAPVIANLLICADVLSCGKHKWKIGLGILGSISCLGLSFTTLSPTIIGSIVGIISAIPYIVNLMLDADCTEDLFEPLFDVVSMSGSSIIIGASFAAVADCLFHGFMLNMTSVGLMGALIGLTAPFASQILYNIIVVPAVKEVASEISSI